MRSGYASYVPSGVPWVGDIPGHWSTAPLRAVFAESKAKNTGMCETNLLSLSHGRIVRKDIQSRKGLLPESFETYQIVDPEHLVFRFTDLQNDQRSLRSARATERGIITSAYITARPVGIDAKYAEYLMRSYDTSKVFYGLGGGVRQSLKFADIARIPILLPPAQEQRAIASYLDFETAAIDDLIVAQVRLIELLSERRSSLIATALLGDLDSHAERKPSGDPRLGSIPAHWSMVPTRYLATITTGSKDSADATPDGEYPFYVRGREVLRIDHFSFDCEAVMTPGDGQGGTGKVFHYVNGPFEAHQRVYIFKDFRHIDGWYFYYYLSTFLGAVALAGSNTVTMESLRRPVLADFQIAVPPVGEQRRITALLDAQTAKIDALIREAERLVEIAQERRGALITAAVTGQINVREVA